MGLVNLFDAVLSQNLRFFFFNAILQSTIKGSMNANNERMNE